MTNTDLPARPRVLIVDDRSENLYLLRTLFEGQGFDVDEASNGVEALRLAIENPPQIIISDLLMPEMDGYSLLRTWKSDAKLKEIPFAVYTATFTDRQGEKLARDMGADAFILKPTESEDLLTEIRDLLAKAKRGELAVVNRSKKDEAAEYKLYSEILVRKLEEKSLTLETINLSLVESEARTAGIIASAMDAIITIDSAQRIVLFNAAAETMFKCAADEALGQSIDRFIPERFRHEHPNHVRTFGETKVTTRSMRSLGGIFGLRADGEEFPIEASISQLETHGENFYTVILRDITKRKMAEAQNRQLNETLETRVAERTADLESFSYSVSHDLRAPLRHIDGFVQLLAKREVENLDDTSAHYLDVISAAVSRMGKLIDELLAFSRTGRQELKSRRVDLNLLVKQSQQELVPPIEGRNIEWKISKLPPVDGDPVLLGLVMTNLMSNAIKYTRNRENAAIEIGALDDSAKQATIFVRDNGAGFDMQYADKLFGVFQRLHRENEFEGIGIGLATVQKIVNRHGGRIWAEAEPDKGATFYFMVNRAKGEKNDRKNDPAGRG